MSSTPRISEGSVINFQQPTFADLEGPAVFTANNTGSEGVAYGTLADQITAAALAAGENDDMLPSSPTYKGTVKPPWVDAPVEFNAVDVVNYVSLPAIGAQAVVVQIQVPPGYNGIIQSYGNNFVGGGWTGGSGTVLWQILHDGAAIKGYNAIPDSLGNPAAPTKHPSGFRIFENQIIQLVVKNISTVVASQLVGGRLAGWLYPTRYEDPAVWV